MIIKLVRLNDGNPRFLMHDKEGVFQRTVFPSDLPERILRALSMKECTYWFATRGDGSKIALHATVPTQEW